MRRSIHQAAPWPRDTPYRCWYCGARFLSYPHLETVPPVNLPSTPAQLRRMATCGASDCARREDFRLDACVNAIMRGETQAAGDEHREPAPPPQGHWSDPSGFFP